VSSTSEAHAREKFADSRTQRGFAAATTSNDRTSNAEHRIETPKTFAALTFGVGCSMFSVRCFRLRNRPAFPLRENKDLPCITVSGCRAVSRTIQASLAGLATITRPPSCYGQLFQGQSAQSTMSPAPANLAANLTAAEVRCVHVRIG
jgi:hypothetical protein